MLHVWAFDGTLIPARYRPSCAGAELCQAYVGVEAAYVGAAAAYVGAAAAYVGMSAEAAFVGACVAAAYVGVEWE